MFQKMDISEVVVLCDQVRKKQSDLKEDSARQKFHSNSPDLDSSHKIT